MATFPPDNRSAPQWLSMLPYWATTSPVPSTRGAVLERLRLMVRGRRAPKRRP